MAEGYEIAYTRAADRFFSAHEELRDRYEEAIRRLMTDDHPETVDLRRIQGKRNSYYRIRLGGWRVIYEVVNGRIIVITTLLAGSRGDVYKKAGALK